MSFWSLYRLTIGNYLSLAQPGNAINDRESTTFDEDQVMCDVTRKHVYENLSGKLVSDQESQTVYSKYELSAKVEIMILNSATVHRYHNNNIVRKLCSHRRPNMSSHKIAFAVSRVHDIMHKA